MPESVGERCDQWLFVSGIRAVSAGEEVNKWRMGRTFDESVHMLTGNAISC